MKELTELPASWAVKFDCSIQQFQPVLDYLNTKFSRIYLGTSNNTYYGVNSAGTDTISSIKDYYDTILTIDQFIKLTTKNMKTELLGLPIIKGEKHHLEAFVKDCEKFGYTIQIGQTPFCFISHNTIGLKNVLSSPEDFTTLYLGGIQYQKSNTKEFQLPSDWSNALDFMKENMDRWNKIQEENKEPEFKIGDIITFQYGNGNIGKVSKLTKIRKEGRELWGESEHGNHHLTYQNCYRLATPQEIEEYNNKPKIFKMTSTSGDFELEVSKKGIYYRPEDKWLSSVYIKDMLLSLSVLSGGYIHFFNAPGSYNWQIETVKIGCKSGSKISEWKEVYDYFKSLQ